MRKLFLTMALLLIGIIAPILACSDNSAQAAAAGFVFPAIAHEQASNDASFSQMPWSENKNLSDRDINDIMNKR